jgi:hypothetical protein
MEIISDQNLKSYFLGTLAVEAAERLEEQCAADAELTEQAHIIESELADDYLRGRLSADERRLFEKNYLTTDARREKLRFAESLWKVANEKELVEDKSAPSFWKTLPANYRTLAFGGLTAAIIFGTFGLFWFNFNKNPETAQQINADRSLNSNAHNQIVESTQNLNVFNQNSNVNSANFNAQKSAGNAAPKPTAAPEIKSAPKPVAPPAPNLAAFVLLPGTLRSEGEQFIKIAPETDSINLQLTLPKDAAKYQTYRAVLKTADGKTVSTAPNLKSLELFLSAEKLANGTYIVFLEGQNAQNPAESVAEYTFRVRR